MTASSYECDENYEISSREKFRLVIYKTLNILVKESGEDLDVENYYIHTRTSQRIIQTIYSSE